VTLAVSIRRECLVGFVAHRRVGAAVCAIGFQVVAEQRVGLDIETNESRPGDLVVSNEAGHPISVGVKAFDVDVLPGQDLLCMVGHFSLGWLLSAADESCEYSSSGRSDDGCLI